MRTVDAMWCETTIMVMPRRRLMPASKASMRLTEIGSRPENGSSQSRISGRRIMARASAARRSMPPESWPGRRSSTFSRPTDASCSRTRVGISCSVASRVLAQRQGEVVEHRHGVQQRAALEQHAEP